MTLGGQSGESLIRQRLYRSRLAKGASDVDAPLPELWVIPAEEGGFASLPQIAQGCGATAIWVFDENLAALAAKAFPRF